MKELKTILATFNNVDFTQRKAALATVVNVRGSSYRSPGARMLITDDGKWVGSISGGCLEGDALRKARQVMTENKPMTITYDTREESNQNLGIGLGCNGVIDVLIEPVFKGSETISLIQKIVTQNEPVALATRVRGEFAGEKFLLAHHLQPQSKFSDSQLNPPVLQTLIEVFTHHRSETKTILGEEIFIELIQPVVSLIIFGGGFDARPVSTLAKSLGWDVQVTDECVSHIAPVFFPTADKLSLCQREFIDRDFVITPYTACVLMSHNYEYDRDVLKKLIQTTTPYIGILGPRKRFDKMVAEFETQNIILTPEDLQRIHSPIGLDIGAETPDEIALSILAEIQSKFANRSGGFLKYRSGPIHERKGDQVFKQVYLHNETENKSVNG